ncbi:MAG: TonB-dependent receptor [Bacteroidota bacterium]
MVVLIMSILLCSNAWAQFTATGTVNTEGDEPLVGASVLLKGSTLGAITGNDGSFSIKVPGNSGTLIVSFVGYKTSEFEITSSNPNIEIKLGEEVTTVDEVIIVGYGQEKRGSNTGAVSTVNSDVLEQVPLGSFEQTLQGNVAGVQSIMSNGQPGANVNILIRGQGSISASSDPLFVIDGIPVASGNLTVSAETSNPLATMNPNDIESVTVLKDAAATAIYGSRGANGVILITTKSGTPGKAKVEFRTQIGVNDWAIAEKNRLRGLTAEEYTHLYIEGYQNRSGEDIETIKARFDGQFPDPQTGLPAVDIIPDGNGGYSLGEIRVDTRWLDELSRKGLNQSYDLSVSGGSSNMTYFVSGSYFGQEAPIIGSDLERLSSRANVSIQVSPKFKITNNLNISRTTQNGMNDATRWANPLYNGYLMAPVVPIRDAEGLYYDGHKGFFMGGNNPVGSLAEDGDDVQTWTMNRILDNVSLSYEIVDGLSISSAWAFDLLNYQEFYFRNGRYGDGRNLNGLGTESTRNILNWIGTQTMNYNKSFDGVHNMTLLAGYESQKSSTRSVITTGNDFAHPSLRTLASAAEPNSISSTLTEFAFTSVFARANYNFAEKYFLSGSVRNDGSSRFGANQRFGTFWSVGVAWRLDQESFLQASSFITALKLRASYGVLGNAGIGNYEHIGTINFSGIDYDGNPGGAPGQIGNPDLTWEKSTTVNVGLDFAILNNRLDGTIEYFNRGSDALLLDVPISRTTGFASKTQNFGSLENRGLEITLNANIINGRDLKWSVGGNITFLRNMITKLDEEFIAGTKLRREGEDYQSFFLAEWAGVDPENGDPLWYTDSSRTATTNNFAEAERFLSDKTATPSHFGGFNTRLSWKGLSLSLQFSHAWDQYLYDATAWVIQGDGRFTPRSQTNLVLDRWQQSGDITDVPKFSWGNGSGSNSRNTTRWLHDGTFIRLRNFTLAYNLPQGLLNNAKIRSARVYVRGVNTFTWTREDNLYIDPEAAFSGVINSPVPNLKTISVGVDLGF